MNEVDNVLAQYGVKGMHWGVITKAKNAYTKARTEDTTPVPVKITAKPGKKIKTEGGKYLPTSEDAKIAAIAKQKAKGSGLQSLSNDEMKVLVDRMGLEERYSKMTPREISVGQKMAQDIMNSPVPELAMIGAKIKYGDSPDPRVQVGFMVADTIIKNAKQNSKKKK
jgi:hypothetical protein